MYGAQFGVRTTTSLLKALLSLQVKDATQSICDVPRTGFLARPSSFSSSLYPYAAYQDGLAAGP